MMPTQPSVATTPWVRRRAGFSLVEMIGVLAIIAILAVVIVPKVFSTIAASRVTAAVASINSMKTAVTEFTGRYGTLPITGNNSRIDDLLITAQIVEGRFAAKVGTQPVNPPIPGSTWARNATTGAWTATGGSNQTSQSRIICVNSNANAPSASRGANYRLQNGLDLPAGSRVVSAVVANLTANDARELSLRIDGDAFSESTATTADNGGKVVYAAPNGQGLTTAYVYIVHQ